MVFLYFHEVQFCGSQSVEVTFIHRQQLKTRNVLRKGRSLGKTFRKLFLLFLRHFKSTPKRHYYSKLVSYYLWKHAYFGLCTCLRSVHWIDKKALLNKIVLFEYFETYDASDQRQYKMTVETFWQEKLCESGCDNICNITEKLSHFAKYSYYAIFSWNL